MAGLCTAREGAAGVTLAAPAAAAEAEETPATAAATNL